MRRILKTKLPVVTYIQRAVEAGVYRSNEELEQVRKERMESADDLRTIMRRFRQNIIRGSNIHDYPVEYVILKKHPPIPDPPRIPAKIARRMKEPINPTEILVRKQLRRQEQQEQERNRRWGETTASSSSTGTSSTSMGPISTEDYYRRLFGMSAPPLNTALGQKSAGLQRAYAAAIKQYELQRIEGLSEMDAMAKVDALLAEQHVNEQRVSHQRATQVREWHQKRQQQPQPPQGQEPAQLEELQYLEQSQQDNDRDATTESKKGFGSDLESVFGNDPRSIEAMMIWSERLAAVPYHEWTIGASTALDHWIARRVLQLSDETWQTLLEGDDPALLSRGRDIVVARESLFPETRVRHGSGGYDTDGNEDHGLENDDTPTLDNSKIEKSIEELLASIGGLAMPVSRDNKKEEPTVSLPLDDEILDLDAKVEQLVNQLQDWRRRNMEKPYNDWDTKTKNEFNAWMLRYVNAVASKATRGQQVDLDSTREALLSQPPLSADDSNAFWSQLHDEGRAAQLLDRMRKDGPPPGATFLHASFWDLPYDRQLDRLLNLGAIRPLLDEYCKETDRIKFLQRYGDTMLTGVELEHLVPDPDGPVRARDIDSATAYAMGVSSEDRFRVVRMPYRATEDMSAQEKTRALFAAWNQHKAGRARYEEKLFKTGRLGLRYSDKLDETK